MAGPASKACRGVPGGVRGRRPRVRGSSARVAQGTGARRRLNVHHGAAGICSSHRGDGRIRRGRLPNQPAAAVRLPCRAVSLPGRLSGADRELSGGGRVVVTGPDAAAVLERAQFAVLAHRREARPGPPRRSAQSRYRTGPAAPSAAGGWGSGGGCVLGACASRRERSGRRIARAVLPATLGWMVSAIFT